MRTTGLIVSVTLLGGCSQSSYKLINVPYCQVPAGQARQGFAESVTYLYNAGSGAGQGPLSGDWPSLGLGMADSVNRSKMVLAVVACSPVAPSRGVATVSSHPTNAGQDLTATHVPVVCPGQRTLFHGTLSAVDDATARARGYHGFMRFPDLALTCPVGTLQRTTSADIEPRPR